MIEIVVTVPPDTVEPVCLTGDGDALGNWRADAVRLERFGDGTFRTRLDLPAGPAHYLATCGRWREAENDGHGRERSPRVLEVSGPLTVDLHVAGWGRESIRYHPEFPSAHLANARPISVYLPTGYDLEPDRRFPVLYLNDGQNLFDAHSAFAGVPWACDETAERLVRAGAAAPAILVGVGNTPDRLQEYGPRQHDGADSPARNYGRFLVEELKPFIDRTFRTRPDRSSTGIGGSSMGGLIALQLLRWHPETFGRCAAISPSLWWDRESLLRSLTTGPDLPPDVRIWLDMGGQEGATPVGMKANIRRARRLAQLLNQHAFEYHYLEDPDGTHDEATWGRRFEPALTYLYPAKTH